jgi:hypothetical protein
LARLRNRSACRISSYRSADDRWIGRFVAAFLLVAFFVQGYIAQTHFHGADTLTPRIVAQAVGDSSTADHPAIPSEDDRANCLLCQAVVQANAFATPFLVTLSLPIQSLLGSVAIISTHIAMVVHSDHGWHQRAPPHS